MRPPYVKSVIFFAAFAILAFFGPSLYFAFRFAYEIQSASREQRERIESANLREIRAEADRLLGQHNLQEHEHITLDISTVGDHIRQLQPTHVTVFPGKLQIELQGGFHHIGVMVFATSSDAPLADGSRELIDRVWLYEDTE